MERGKCKCGGFRKSVDFLRNARASCPPSPLLTRTLPGFCTTISGLAGSVALNLSWDPHPFHDPTDVRHLLGVGAECGVPMRVTVVDLQVHLGLRALRWTGAFAKPRIVADSILAGSKFCNAYARNMLYGILEDVHRPVPRWSRIDQHVDDLAQCAVGRQTAVVKQTVEAAEFIAFACDR